MEYIAAPIPPKVAAQKRGGHGRELRGELAQRGSDLTEGRFGRMFRTLPPAKNTIGMLEKLADVMAAEPEDHETPEDKRDGEENERLPAGYTYLGQFIDHDLTFDPNSSLEQLNDPEALVDFRTPRFDLDSVYGRGPADQPYMYADDFHFLLGRKLTGSEFDANTRDLPRNNPEHGPLGRSGDPRALIGDPRNDENVIVSQLQGIFLRFHNRMADKMLAARSDTQFSDVQQEVRWHYQWVVLHDFLPRIVDMSVLTDVLPGFVPQKRLPEDFRPNLRIFNWRKSPFMPVEFSAAVYRFGHSMVRPIYRLNSTLPGRFHIFSKDPTDSLVGFREFPSIWAIDWRLFFPIEERPKLGRDRVQPAYKMDTSIVNPLKSLPNPIVPAQPTVQRNLAYRNLVRGLQMGLPSGQSVARRIGAVQLKPEELVVGKATGDKADQQTPLIKVDPQFEHNAPLWYYILAEAQRDKNDTKLGGVGARIVAEVFVGLMMGDSHSFLAQYPSWCPAGVLDEKNPRPFDMAEFIREAVKAP
ncbi:MAG TPA: heme peroxidase family protein [Gemmatimonadaceae bacterium]|nr:heme peroxidase family protein [Gemmatimonadaceae bacterium]